MAERSLLDEDPVLFESASYWECRRHAREHRARWYADILDRARRSSDDPLFEAMQALVSARQEPGGPDLCFSRTLSAWIGALADDSATKPANATGHARGRAFGVEDFQRADRCHHDR